MIPKIAARGTSFKGAHLYYGHDKHADTTERVLFFDTLNMRTDDPDKAWKVMAYTAMREEELKKASGIHWNGQETEKPVYPFSLAWDKDQDPTHEEMKEAVISALKYRKMDELQSMLYGHDDTDHKHIHGVVNLIHPKTGKTADIWQDQLGFSEWSQAYELENGGIRCDQRVENNKKRQQGEFVKYRENVIQNAWDQSKTGQEFADLLEEKGYMLAQGNKRVVIVDHYGKTMNPTRKIAGEDGKNIKAKILKERLADLELSQLKTAEEAIKIQAERAHIDREAYNAEQEQKYIDTAIEQEKRRLAEEKQRGTSGNGTPPLKPADQNLQQTYQSYAEQLDRQRQIEAEQQRKRHAKEAELDRFYQVAEQEKELQAAKRARDGSNTFLGRISGQYKRQSESVEALRLTLADAKRRQAESLSNFERQQVLERTQAEARAQKKEAHLEPERQWRSTDDMLDEFKQRASNENKQELDQQRDRDRDIGGYER